MDNLIHDDADKTLVSYLSSLHLMPYLYDVTRKASLLGISCLFSMAQQFPEDATCASLEGQYMIGNNLLVIPVHHANSLMEYYLPPGKWTNYLTGVIRFGGQWYKEKTSSLYPFLFIRENSIIPTSISEVDGYPPVQFRIYHLKQGTRVTGSFYDRYTSSTWSYLVRRTNRQLTISSSENVLYSFRMMNQPAQAADHAFLLEEGHDIIVQPDINAAIVTVQLHQERI